MCPRDAARHPQERRDEHDSRRQHHRQDPPQEGRRGRPQGPVHRRRVGADRPRAGRRRRARRRHRRRGRAGRPGCRLDVLRVGRGGVARPAEGPQGRRAGHLDRRRPRLPQADRPRRAADRRAGGRPRPPRRGRALRRAQARRERRQVHAHHAPRPQLGRPRRRARQDPPARGQPPPGGLAGQALHRPRHGVPGPDPGGQPGPDPCGREVRLHQGLQVLDLRDVVDPPGDHPRDGRPGAHHPHPGAHGRGHQQARPHTA
ncbi:unannotated protein [freshwater metagenome]|uniref:Unannotated protein n=1 Tax=freshwater metagenome TaxID=449393 RepID=A0A6J7I654_9ZZZZ